MTYHHGVRVLEVSTGARPIRVVATSIIGLIATSATADADTFPAGELALITDVRGAIALAGTADDSNTLLPSLTAIADQASAIVVVGRAAIGEDAEETIFNVLAMVTKLLTAESALGVKPRILGAPGHDVPDVAAQLATVAGKLRAMAYVSANGQDDTEVADILNYRADYGARELMLIDGRFTKASGAVEATAVALGLRARIDQEQGWHKTLSNVAVNGVTGIETPRSFDLQSSATDIGLLNEAAVTGLVRMNGFRFWGSRTCSDDELFAFESATRTAQIMADTIAEGVAWAIDKPLHPSLARDIIENINAVLRRLTAGGYILGGKAWIDPSSNPQADLAGGRLQIDYDYTPCPPLEDLSLTQRITDSYLANFAAQVAG